MRIIDKLFGVDKLKTELKALQSTASLQAFTNFSAQIFPSWHVFKEIEAYRIQDDVYSVVSRLARTSAMVPWYGFDLNNGEDLPPNDKLSIFLRSITVAEKIKLYTYIYLQGECFIYKERLEFGVNAGINKIHFLHPSNVTVVISEGYPADVLGYIYRDASRGIELTFDRTDVVHIKYFNPVADVQESYRGLSPIKVLGRTLTRLNAGKDASTAQMQNGGVPGIVYQKDGDFDAVEKTGLRRENFSRYIKNPDNKGAPYMAAGEMGYLALGLPLADLEVAELAKIDFKKICNVYSLSDRLFNNDATGSEVSDDNAQKGMYTNAIMPTLIMVQDAFNTEVLPDIPGGLREIRYDFSDITVLQENMLEKMNALAAAPVMVPNDIREAMGFDRSDNPLMDIEYVKTGYQPISDFEEIEPIE